MSRREKWIAATIAALLVLGAAGTWAWKAHDRPKARFCTLEGLVLSGEPGEKYNPIHKGDDCLWYDRNGNPLPAQYQTGHRS